MANTPKKKVARGRRTARPQPVPATATAARYDGGALVIQVVIDQPEAVARFADQALNAHISSRRLR